MDLLTTYTHHSEIQAITALSLISTLYKSPQHPLSHFPACCIFVSRSLSTALKVEILQLHTVRFYHHSIPCRSLFSPFAPIVFRISARHGPGRKHSYNNPFFVARVVSRFPRDRYLVQWRVCCCLAKVVVSFLFRGLYLATCPYAKMLPPE
jgi:hypothetical protein